MDCKCMGKCAKKEVECEGGNRNHEGRGTVMYYIWEVLGV